jgi:hypothetical protein
VMSSIFQMRHLKGLVTWDSMSCPVPSLYHAILVSQDSLVWTYGKVLKEGKSGNLSSLLGSHLVPSMHITMALSWSLHYTYHFLLFCNVPSKALNSFKIFITWGMEPGGDGIVSGG